MVSWCTIFLQIIPGASQLGSYCSLSSFIRVAHEDILLKWKPNHFTLLQNFQWFPSISRIKVSFTAAYKVPHNVAYFSDFIPTTPPALFTLFHPQWLPCCSLYLKYPSSMHPPPHGLQVYAQNSHFLWSILQSFLKLPTFPYTPFLISPHSTQHHHQSLPMGLLSASLPNSAPWQQGFLLCSLLHPHCSELR